MRSNKSFHAGHSGDVFYIFVIVFVSIEGFAKFSLEKVLGLLLYGIWYLLVVVSLLLCYYTSDVDLVDDDVDGDGDIVDDCVLKGESINSWLL